MFMLYQLLSGRAPYAGDAESVLAQVMNGPPPSLRQPLETPSSQLSETVRQPAGTVPSLQSKTAQVSMPRSLSVPIPDDLVRICERAMARIAYERYADAAALSMEIVAWLEGAQRHERARVLVLQAQSRLPEVAALKLQAAHMLEQSQHMLAQQPRWAEAELKQPAWALEDQAKALLTQAETMEDAVIKHLHGALLEAPDSREVHHALAQIYRQQHEKAERERSPVAQHYEALLRGHDRGEHATWLQGTGAVTLISRPAGARVQLYRYLDRGRRRVPQLVGTLGLTPLIKVPIELGDWLLQIEHPECERVHYPVSIQRLQHWDGVPPGASEARVIELPARGALKPRQIYVPAGWFQRGGDAAASGGAPRQWAWVEAFVVDQFASTQGEYQLFLDALCARGEYELAERYAPREQRGGALSAVWQGQRLVLSQLSSEHPIVNLDWASADAFTRWQGGRLLSNDEWEKAARGVDGRIFPWGDDFDPSFSRSRDSSASISSLVAVTEYPIDESPYGVRGLAGNACTWCERDGAERAWYRGGAWAFHEISVRSACRFATDLGYRYFGLGVRVARSWSSLSE
jgi:serine/threonine-protein kinase